MVPDTVRFPEIVALPDRDKDDATSALLRLTSSWNVVAPWTVKVSPTETSPENVLVPSPVTNRLFFIRKSLLLAIFPIQSLYRYATPGYFKCHVIS